MTTFMSLMISSVYPSTEGISHQRRNDHTVDPPHLEGRGTDPITGRKLRHMSLPVNTGRLGTVTQADIRTLSIIMVSCLVLIQPFFTPPHKHCFPHVCALCLLFTCRRMHQRVTCGSDWVRQGSNHQQFRWVDDALPPEPQPLSLGISESHKKRTGIETLGMSLFILRIRFPVVYSWEYESIQGRGL